MSKDKSKLEKDILKVVLFDIKPIVLEDKRGRYFLYCNFDFHKGFVGKEMAKECMKRNCSHYTIFREEENEYR